ncbi:hypothetical protein ACFPT7_18665 [Acidicapsa dinghuensis]|uniref:Glycosyltransferase RgtA/B/C/D-like domain-containing protein n=1 Tax=Acidicapsa dinghuensis TaxID=2218256 RepID=A0ABW1EJ77_9BACT|nr:hypothetical protein [Acidicapsa dinghuensis]
MLNLTRTRAFLKLLRTHRSDVHLLLFLAAGLVGVVIQWIHPADAGDEMMRLAQNIVSTGSYRDPFRVMATGPTAMNPPLYPLMVAFLIRILRLPSLVYLAAVLGSMIANAVTAVLLPRIANVFFADELPGIAASILWIGMMPCLPGWDTSYTVAGILLFCLLIAVPSESKGRELQATLLAGVIAGLLFLLNPSVLLVVIPWMAYTVWRAEGSRSKAVRNALIACSVLAVAIFGWCTRNYLVLGAFVTRTNLGATMYASNNDCATPSLISEEFDGCYQAHHPNTNPAEAQAVLSLGEVRYDRLKTQETKQWIASHEGQFLQLTAERFIAFWFPVVEKIPPDFVSRSVGRGGSQAAQSWIAEQNVTAYVMRFATVLSIPGLIVMMRRREPVIWFIIAALALYPLLYYVVVSDMRYRYPVLWISLLAAGYLIRLLEPPRLPRSPISIGEHGNSH